MRTSVRETGLQYKRLANIGGKRLPQGVDLFLKLRHSPGLYYFLQNPHMPREKLTGIRIEVRVRGNDGNLQISQYIFTCPERETYQMKHNA